MKKIAALFFLLVGITIFAQNEEKLEIKEIEILNNNHVPYELIENSIVSRKGAGFSAGDMIEDYKKLKALKYFDDVLIYPDIFEGGAKLFIDVKENIDAITLLKANGIKPESEREKIDRSLHIESIEIFGNNKISSDEILKHIPLQIGGLFSKEKTLEGKEKILSMGYFRDVSPEILKYGKGIYVKYNVYENPIINGIAVQGNTLIQTEELLRELETKPGEVYNLNILKKDYEKMLTKYRDKGYVLANIANVAMNEDMKIVVKISEGIVRDVKFKRLTKKDDTIKASSVSNEDEPLKTKDYVLEREVELKKGNVFELAPFQNSMKNIFRLGYFKDIKPDFEMIPGDEDGRIVVFYLDESKTGSIMGGVSYAPNLGVAGNLGVSDNNFNGNSQNLGVNIAVSQDNTQTYELSFSDPWIKGTKRLSLSTSIYKKDEVSSLTTSQYDLPEETINDETIKKSYRDSYSSYTNKLGFTINVGRELMKNIRGTLGYKIEQLVRKNRNHSITSTISRKKKLEVENISSNVIDVDRETKEVLYEQKTPNSTTIKTPADNALLKLLDDTDDEDYIANAIYPSLIYDTRNNIFNATDGEYAKVGLTLGNYGNLASSSDYYSILELDLRKYHNFIIPKNSMAYRLVLGAESDSIKTNDLFLLGGSSTIRGYDNNSLIGKYEAVLNVENRYSIDDKVQLILFFDMGNTWDYWRDYIRLDSMKMGYGIGARIETPLGPLRFDYGWPIGDKTNTKGQFYFNIGQMF